jgi:4-hydroxy-tetrahydrodipicolinate reductase
VIGSTGLNEDEQARLFKAATQIPIFYASNFSYGIFLLRSLAKTIIKQGSVKAIEIEDIHHAGKKDRPSGTALLILQELKPLHSAISIRSIRTGEEPGKHVITFHLPMESIKIVHQAKDRKLFAFGALQAAKWLIDKPAGFYSVEDLFS